MSEKGRPMERSCLGKEDPLPCIWIACDQWKRGECLRPDSPKPGRKERESWTCTICGKEAVALYPLLPGSPAFCSDHYNPEDAGPFGVDFSGPDDFDIPVEEFLPLKETER